MSTLFKTTEFIKGNGFMSLLAAEGLVPGASSAPIASELRATTELFEVVNAKPAKQTSSLRIVRPASWGKTAQYQAAMGV